MKNQKKKERRKIGKKKRRSRRRTINGSRLQKLVQTLVGGGYFGGIVADILTVLEDHTAAFGNSVPRNTA